jgi:energy-coupling factor transporter ATP-binding protein EcfA2
MVNYDSYNVHDVFTPATPARLTFIERETINNKLVNALQTPGKQVVVYGHSGSGKTTLLLNKLCQIYEDHITTRCMCEMTFEQILIDAFDQLAPFFIAEQTTSKSTSISPTISAEYIGIKNELACSFGTDNKIKKERFLPPQLTASTLGRLLGETKCCWVLEDFHKIKENDKAKLSQVLKVFMDMADIFRELKIITIGAVGTGREVIQYDPEMRNRVAEIHVPLMSNEEIYKIIAKGQELLNFKMPETIQKGIVHYSNGLASVCHHLCLNICNAAGINMRLNELIELEDQHLQAAIGQYLEETSDTLKAAIDIALNQKRKSKFDNCRLILATLAIFGQDGAKQVDIYKEILKQMPNYPRGNLTQYLDQLTSDQRSCLLKYDPYSSKYSFSDPLYRTFILINLRGLKGKSTEISNIFETFLSSSSNEMMSIIKDKMTKQIKIIISSSKKQDEI